jgi:transposase
VLGPAKVRDLDRPVVLSLDAAVPKDDFYRHLHRALDLSFVRDLTADCYAGAGRPSIDPVVFFKLQLVMFFEGIRSERQLMRVVADRLSLRWYVGYNLDEPLPDHSSLTRIRDRFGPDRFHRFFEQIVERCRDAGLVRGHELYIDATKVRANADIDSLVPRWYVHAKQHVDTLFGHDTDAEADASAASSTVSAPAPPTLAEENNAAWRLLEQRRLDPHRRSTKGYRRTSDDHVSRTDPDAVPMKHHNGDRVKLGYHDHYVVDGGKARIILAALVTPADVMENQAMLDLLWRVRFRWQLHPRFIAGDTTYGTIENIVAVEREGIRAYVRLPDYEQRGKYFPKSAFTYDAEQDLYRCPRGEALRRYSYSRSDRMVKYRAPRKVCNACPLKERCTPGKEGRKVEHSFDEAYVARVRAYRETEDYKKAIRKRQVWIEPLFGEAKQWHGLRRFRLRGLGRVNMEGLLVAAGQNIKRLLQAKGWGRRPWPAGGVLNVVTGSVGGYIAP